MDIDYSFEKYDLEYILIREQQRKAQNNTKKKNTHKINLEKKKSKE